MSRRAALLLVTTIVVAPGCLWPGKTKNEGIASSLSEADLASIDRAREALTHFAHRYVVNIQGAVARVVSEAPDIETRRRAIFWQVFAASHGRDAAFQQDVVAALVDMWLLCVQMREFFTKGEGRDLFGEQTRFVLEAVRQNEKDIDRVTVAILPKSRENEVRASVQKFASEHPIRFPFSREADVSNLRHAEGAGQLSWWYDKSLAPLRAISGLDQTSLALLKLAEVGRQATLTANYLPLSLRFQSQLLLYDQEFQSALANVKTMSEAVTEIGRTAEALPDAIGGQIERSLESLKKNDEVIKNLLALLASFLTDLQKASVDVGQAGVAWEGTTKAIHDMVEDFRGGDEEEAAVPEAGVQPAVATGGAAPFDVNDYGNAAREIARAAEELRGATAEVRSLVSSDTPGVASAAGEINGVVNRVAMYGALLIAAFFAGLIAYRIVAVRLARGA